MNNVVLLGLISLLTDISSEMVYPLIPLYLTNALGATPGIVGVIEGLAESLASLLKVSFGAVSDRLGQRKPLAASGYALSAASKGVLVVAGSWGGVLAARLADRFGKGIRTAPRDALIAEAVSAGRRGAAYGLHRALDTLGAVVGVALAFSFLTAFRGDYRYVFLYSLIPAFLGVVLFLFVRETGHGTDKGVPVRLFLRWSVLDYRLKSFLLISFVFTLGNSSNQFLLLRAQNLGFNPGKVLVLYLVYNLAYALVSYPAGRLSDRVGRRSLLVLGYLAYALVYLGFALAGSPLLLWLLFFLYGVYTGFTEGVEKALVVDIAPARLRATLIGLHATVVGIGLLPASVLAGWLWNRFGPSAPFYFGGATGVLAALGLWAVLRPGAEQPKWLCE